METFISCTYLGSMVTKYLDVVVSTMKSVSIYHLKKSCYVMRIYLCWVQFPVVTDLYC